MLKFSETCTFENGYKLIIAIDNKNELTYHDSGKLAELIVAKAIKIAKNFKS